MESKDISTESYLAIILVSKFQEAEGQKDSLGILQSTRDEYPTIACSHDIFSPTLNVWRQVTFN
jgi:hypothetical protein